jgi:hypothetical protein
MPRPEECDSSDPYARRPSAGDPCGEGSEVGGGAETTAGRSPAGRAKSEEPISEQCADADRSQCFLDSPEKIELNSQGNLLVAFQTFGWIGFAMPCTLGAWESWQNARIFTAWEEGRSGLQAVAGPGLLQQKGLRLFPALKSRSRVSKRESQASLASEHCFRDR